MKFFVVLTVMLFSNLGHCQVVKCKDANGKTIYSDVACPTNATSSAVNLSGGNITEDQARSAQKRKSSVNATSGGEACPLLKDRALQAFARYQEIRNVNSSNASLQALQNLANYCPSAGTCDLINRRVQDAQLRYDEIRNKNAASALDSSLGLMAKYCQAGGARQQPSNELVSISDMQAPVPSAKRSGYQTRDTFGTIVDSQSCHWTKDAYGNDVRSSGCSK